MVKQFVCAMIIGILSCANVYAGDFDCVKFLHVGDKKICMRQTKETSPALAAEIDNITYYARAIPAVTAGSVRFEYRGRTYELYDYENAEYELIHWLSGEDALVNGEWIDRIAIGGALNFRNYGCTWNEERAGYYSADGLQQYFLRSPSPRLDFGTDWYVEITAKVGEPLGTMCVLIDFGSFSDVRQGDAFRLRNNTTPPGRMGTNTKPNGNVTGFSVNTGDAVYTWVDTVTFIFGNAQYDADQSRAFVTWDGNNYYGNSYNTVQWNQWSHDFFLFRGIATGWKDDVYQCGPTTIYDVKVWRRK